VVIDIGLRRHAGDGHHAASTEGADEAESQLAEEVRLLGDEQQGEDEQRQNANGLHSLEWYHGEGIDGPPQGGVATQICVAAEGVGGERKGVVGFRRHRSVSPGG